MGTSIEIRGLDELDARLGKAIDEFPEIRRKAFVALAPELKGLMDGSIDSSGLNDSHGKIKGFQDAAIGSRGGYAAIRASRADSGSANGPGAITNYLENGHRVRRPGKTKPRAKMLRVPGYGFYAASRSKLPDIADRIAESIAEKLHDILEG